MGAKDRKTNQVSAEVVGGAGRDTLQGFVGERVECGAVVYTDDHKGCIGMTFACPRVRQPFPRPTSRARPAPTVSSLSGPCSAGLHGRLPPPEPQAPSALRQRVRRPAQPLALKNARLRYVNEFTGRFNSRSLGALEQMVKTVAGLDGKRLRYCDLVGSSQALSAGWPTPCERLRAMRPRKNRAWILGWWFQECSAS